MRVATWNVNGLRARLGFLLHWLRERKPDLVALQELKLAEGELPREELAAAGYRVEALGQKAWNGVAVLSRTPVEVVQRGLPGYESAGARLLTVRTAAGLLTSLYVPNGKTVTHPDFPEKLAWLDGLARHLSERHDPAEPHLLCGDFNLVPGPLDSWNEEGLQGHIFHTDEERSRFRRLCDWGAVDLFRSLDPERVAFSWWDYRGGAFHRGQGLRIDLLLATAPIAARTTSVEIDREYRKKKDGLIASDHAPVFADLR
jgi:exodeoxyribonuclease-3